MKVNAPKPLRRSLTDEVRDHIRDGIAEGRYKPGEWLKEGAIGEELSVSRTPIREAIRILEAEATLSRRQVSDFYAYREIIEGLAAEMAASVITEDEIEGLDAILLQLEKGRDQTGSELANVNELFHKTIFDISGNRFLNQSLEVINTAKILIWKPVYPSHERWREAQQEHRKMFDALRSRDAITAKAVAQEHVRSAGLTRVAAMISEELEADSSEK
jgi:DNA-binding GntR family transcriptional regulator